MLVGQVTPKGETELTAEERLLRAIFRREGARGAATPRLTRSRTARVAWLIDVRDLQPLMAVTSCRAVSQ